MEELLEKLRRDPESHKGENGKVGIIAGSKDYAGAPALTAKAALRTGCDLATILTSKSISSTVAGYSENFIVGEYNSDYFDTDSLEKALRLDKKVDVTVIGPGLGNPEPEAVKEFLKECNSHAVVDAEALNYVKSKSIENAVLTPHKAEFEQIENDLDLIIERGNLVVKKGAKDTIYDRDGKTVLEAGNPGMTVGGTGDVLTGIIASLIAQDLDRKEAAQLGTWLNGKAGEKATEKHGNGVLATDIAETVSEVLASNT